MDSKSSKVLFILKFLMLLSLPPIYASGYCAPPPSPYRGPSPTTPHHPSPPSMKHPPHHGGAGRGGHKGSGAGHKGGEGGGGSRGGGSRGSSRGGRGGEGGRYNGYPPSVPKPPVVLPPITINPPITNPPGVSPPVVNPPDKLPPIANPPGILTPPSSPYPPCIGSPPGGGGDGVTPSPLIPRTCPIDALKLGLCVDILGGLIHVGLGNPVENVCCPVLKGLLDLEAAICLCTTIRLKLLNLSIFIPLALQVLITCGMTPPPSFVCPLL